MRSRRTSIVTAGLLAILVAPASIAGDQSPKPYQHHSVLVVKRTSNASTMVNKQFSRITGIESVYVNRKARKIIFTLKPDSTPSALAIWQMAEQLQLEPVRLVTAQGNYTSKPDSDAKPNASKKKK